MATELDPHRARVELPSQLVARLEALDPHAPLAARLDAIENLARMHLDVSRFRSAAPSQIARLRALVQALAAVPEYRERLRATLGSVLRDTTAVALLSEAGIPSDRGLARETVDRIARRLLPQPPDAENLERLVSRVFRGRRQCAWIEVAHAELFAELGVALGDVWAPIRQAMSDAVALLTTRISALGLSVDLRERSDPMYVRDSPFFRIPHVSLEEMPMVILECRAQLQRIHEHLETTGVSVDVVYCIDAIRRMLLRIERMLPFLTDRGTDLDRAASARTLLGALTAGRIADESLRQLGRQSLGLLAKKVIERVGHAGEHYVTTTRREYWRMFASAFGGGAIIPFTVAAKFLTLWAQLAPFLEGALISGAYIGSFVAMQLFGLTLATKQPAATAAALAATIKESGKGADRLEELVNLIARISRSQLAAAAGNILAAVPVALAIDLAYLGATGHHFLDEHSAHHALESVDPRNPSTIIFGVLTGALLWISSLGAGWLENWVTYRRLPAAIRDHRLGRLLGRSRMAKVGDFVANHSAAFGGNVTLGALFGMLPKLGAFFGIPLDSRHLTISTAMVAFAACALGPGAITIWTGLGIVVLGLLNFGVSFFLALLVALRARDVTRRERVGLAKSVARSFLRRPTRFFFPPTGRMITAPVPIVPPPKHHDG
jgi:site-specific recombinase